MQPERKRKAERLHYGLRRENVAIMPVKLTGVFDAVTSCGWHEVNDRYCYRRLTDGELLEEYLIIFTVGGEGFAAIGREEYHPVRGNVLIFPKHMPHIYCVPEGGRWEFYWMHVSGANCSALLNHIIDEAGCSLKVSCMDDLVQCVEKLIESEYRYYEREVFAAQMLSQILFTIIGDISAPRRESRKSRRLVMQAVEAIEESYNSPLKLEEIAAGLYVSAEHLIRVFREETGMTPRQYMCRLRMRRACAYLERGELSIGDVAAAVGYRSESAFIARFHDTYGLTPRTFRQFFARHNEE